MKTKRIGNCVSYRLQFGRLAQGSLKTLPTLVLLAVLITSFSSFSLATNNADTAAAEYYTVDENTSNSGQDSAELKNAFEAMGPLQPRQIFQIARRMVVNLLRWSLHEERRPLPDDPYARKLHFGRWINDPNDNTCMNTRARVLVRDSEATVTYRTNKNCVVDSGQWTDSYSGSTFQLAKEIQIDHMVPLKNAYVSGAWQWDYKTRCLYANYEGYKNHLVASSVRENTSKGDRGPEKYLPSNASYRCQYIKDWLAIKLIWGLSMTRDEVAAIDAAVQEQQCDTSEFSMSEKELTEQRKTIGNNLDFCLNK